MSRFDEHLDRDFPVIAERATPSPDAWASIQQRIADRAPTQESEIIMLTENTTRPHRWPMLAGAAAVIALVAGGIALIGNRDDDPTPNDTPTTVTTPDAQVVVPAPDAEVDDPASTVTTTDAEVVDSIPAPEIEVLTLSGQYVSQLGADSVDADGTAQLFGTEQWSGDAEMTGEITGAGYDWESTETAPTGTLQSVLDGTIAGVGSGTLTYTLDFSLDPAAEVAPGRILAGTGDFEGATGSVVVVTTSNENGATAGTYTVELTLHGPSSDLPTAGGTIEPGRYTSDLLGTQITFDLGNGAAGEWSLSEQRPGSFQLVVDNPVTESIGFSRVGSLYNADEALDASTTGLGSIAPDDIDAWIESSGVTVVRSRFVEIGQQRARQLSWRFDPDGPSLDECSPIPCRWTASASADLIDVDPAPIAINGDRQITTWTIDMNQFEPISIIAITDRVDVDAWLTDIVQPIIDSIVLGELAPVIEGGAARVPLRVTATSTFTGVRTDGDTLEDGSVPVTGTYAFNGEMDGEGVVNTLRFLIPPNNETGGNDEVVFTGTIEGVGTGTLTFLDEWRGEPSPIATVVSGTGDFAGATGTMTSTIGRFEFDGPDNIVGGSVELRLVIPRNG